MNVTKPTINALYDIIGQCFQYNRWLDRFVSVLGVKFAMSNTAKLIHDGISHEYPKLSDEIGELCLERYNILVEYASTEEGKQDYESVTEMIGLLEAKIIDFQNMFMGVMKIAFDNNDLNVYSDLFDIMKKHNKIVGQVILLNDKIVNYGEEKIMSFDAQIDKFWILGGE